MRIDITGPISRTKSILTEKDEEGTKIVVPGAITGNRAEFMSGHGTFYNGDDIVASVAGSVRQVSKLITVQPFKSRYRPNVGDVVVGRITEVQQKRWRVDINSIQDGFLNLANISLPGGELRRKSAEDEMRMRMYMEEGDLVVAEVLNVQNDAIQLQARNLRYGKLGQGILVKAMASLMKRRKTHFHDLHFGARVILGRNGWIWIEPPPVDGQLAATGGYTHPTETVAYDVRVVMSRIANCIKILEDSMQPIYETTIIYAYSASSEFDVQELIKPEVMDEVASEVVRNRIAETGDALAILLKMSFPTHSDVVVAETKMAMMKLIGEMLVKAIESSTKPVTLGLSGGSMVTIMAPVILQLTQTQFDKLRLFCVDERLVPLTDGDSNTGSYLQLLSDEFKSKFVIVKDPTDARKAAIEFENGLREWKVEETSGGLPRFDFLFLGLGPDGHTCSLFPGHPLLEYKGSSWVVPIEDSPKPPPRRITITLPVCNAAKQVVFIATGAAKADLVKNLILNKDDSIPAGMVKPETPVTWVLDPEAAQHLGSDATGVRD